MIRAVPAFAKGDRVSWSVGRHSAEGTVVRVITRRAKVGGRTVVGSAKDPRYVVRDANSGRETVRKGDSLRPPPEPRRRSAPPWPILAAGTVGLVLIVGAILYFAQMPGRAADNYREDAGQAFERVDDSLFATFQSFRVRYFRGLAIRELQAKRLDEANIGKVRRAFAHEYASDAQAIAKANAAIDASERAIDDAEPDLTHVDSPPLLAGKGDLGEAEDDADAAGAYLDDARDYLSEYRDLTAYASKSLAGERETSAAILDESPEDPESASLETFKQATGATLVRLRRVKRKFAAAGSGSEDATAFHKATGNGIDLTIDYYAKIQRAFNDLSVSLFDEANAEFKKRLKGYGISVVKQFIHLQDGSPISRAIGDLEDQEDSLSESLDVEAGPRSLAPSLIPPEPGKAGDRR
jgi:hypothetical protein